MSEHDIKLGGVAATKFGGTAKNAYEKDMGSGIATGYKSNEEVREFYLNDKSLQRGESGIISSRGAGGASSGSNTPAFWEKRQMERELQNEAYNGGTAAATVKKSNDTNQTFSAEVALVQIATHTLETMARSLSLEGSKSNVKIPMEERAAFAKAVKEAMGALAKQA